MRTPAGWTLQTVRVKARVTEIGLERGKARVVDRDVEAFVKDGLAVHPAVGADLDRPVWTVTHVRSGKGVLVRLTRTAAFRAAKALLAEAEWRGTEQAVRAGNRAVALAARQKWGWGAFEQKKVQAT